MGTQVEVSKQKNYIHSNNYCIRSTAPPATLIRLAALNNACAFNLFLVSSDSKGFPKWDPRVVHAEIKKNLSNWENIDYIRYTRTGMILLSTLDLDCAVEICNLTTFLGVPTSTRVIWENISSRFLLFHVPTDFPLEELAQEIEAANKLHVLSIQRFMGVHHMKDTSPVLVTSLGTALPECIKVWLSIQEIKHFVDRPRQCAKCFKFGHPTGHCSSEQICASCGTPHVGPCSSSLRCVNCSEEHSAEFLQCPSRLREANLLHFKCRNFLTFSEARRRFEKKPTGQYAQIASVQYTDIEKLNNTFEARTNNLVTLMDDIILKQSNIINDIVIRQNKDVLMAIDSINEGLMKIKEWMSPLLPQPVVRPLDTGNFPNEAATSSYSSASSRPNSPDKGKKRKMRYRKKQGKKKETKNYMVPEQGEQAVGVRRVSSPPMVPDSEQVAGDRRVTTPPMVTDSVMEGSASCDSDSSVRDRARAAALDLALQLRERLKQPIGTPDAVVSTGWT